MDGNEEAARKLESRIATLSGHLEYFKKRPQENQKEETSKRIRNLQLCVCPIVALIHPNSVRFHRQLELVGKEMEVLNSQGAVRKAFFSANQAGSIKGYQEKVRTASEEVQVRRALDPCNPSD